MYEVLEHSQVSFELKFMKNLVLGAQLNPKPMSPSFIRTTGTIELILQPKHGVAVGEQSVVVQLHRLTVRLLNRS